MATKLEKPLKREVTIEGQPYMLTISPDGLKLVPKGKRDELELAWKSLVSGVAALATALNAAIAREGRAIQYARSWLELLVVYNLVELQIVLDWCCGGHDCRYR